MKRPRHRLQMMIPRSQWLLLAVAVALAMFLVGSFLYAQQGREQAQEQTGVVEQQRDATAAQAASLAEQIKAACTSGDLGGPVCQQAAEVAATPVPPVPGPAGPTGPPGPPPTSEQIQSAVDAYLAANPPPAGRPPTASEVAAAAASYLTANPPSPGRPPTAGEIAAAVEEYFAQNPPPAGEPGEDGEDGAPGRPPTAAEIRAAVDAYLAANPPPAGEPGVAGGQGVQGVSVQDIRAEERDTGCVLVFELFDPATGATMEQAVPVADDVCADGVLPEIG